VGDAWRLAHPAEAAAEAEWEAKILNYYRRHGITPQPGEAGYSVWLHAATTQGQAAE
jgi:hypothetical protein